MLLAGPTKGLHPSCAKGHECGLTVQQEQGKAGCDTIPRAYFNQENEKG